jgi:four helix bundle protein
MNTYDKIYYEDFRRKYAYQKSIAVVEKLYKVIGICDTADKKKHIKLAISVVTEVAQGVGSILSDKQRDFHYRVAIRRLFELNKLLEYGVSSLNINEESVADILKYIQEAVKLLRTYRNQLNTKQEEIKQMKKLDIKNVEIEIDKIKGFRDLKAYVIATEFYTKLYSILNKLPKYEMYGVFDQLDRCSMSILSNISEGKGKGELGYKASQANFYAISFGSCTEAQCWLDLMLIKEYITVSEHKELNIALEQVKKLIISYIKESTGAILIE